MQSKLGVWYEGYTIAKQENMSAILRGTDVQSRKHALEVFLNDKRNIDYYFDNGYQIMQAIKKANIDVKVYGLETREIAQSRLHIVFPKTERGYRLKNIFDQGLERLYCNGELLKIYTRWQYEMPQIKKSCKGAQ